MTSQFEVAAATSEEKALEPGNAPVILSREEFEELKGMIVGALKITEVRMADGRPTQRMCTACEMFPIISHQVGNVTCGCVCHKMREAVVRLERM